MIDKMKNMCIIPPPPPSFGNILLEICGYLRCRFTKNSPRRTKSTPTGIFCAFLASASPISKRYFSTATDGGGHMQQRCFCEAKTRRQCVHGWTGWLSEASFVLKTRLFPIYMDVYREKVCTEVHLLTGYLYRIFAKDNILVILSL